MRLVGSVSGYPVVGFYCPLHIHQKAKLEVGLYLAPPDPTLEEHLRRGSYVTPERHLGTEMLKVPDLRGTVKSGVKGGQFLDWLEEKKGLKEEATQLTMARLLQQGVLVPTNMELKGKPFSKKGEYRLVEQTLANNNTR